MIDASLFNALTAREFLGDQVMEAYLASKPGLIGAVGFRKIAENFSDTAEQRDTAQQEGIKLTNAIKDKWRKVHEKGQNEPVSRAQVAAMIKEWTDWEHGPIIERQRRDERLAMELWIVARDEYLKKEIEEEPSFENISAWAIAKLKE